MRSEEELQIRRDGECGEIRSEGEGEGKGEGAGRSQGGGEGE